MRYCGRHFEAAERGLSRELLKVPQINRARLSREVCERLGWRRDNGDLKDMNCRGGRPPMRADCLFTLPLPRNPKPVAYRSYAHIEQAVPQPAILAAMQTADHSVDE